MNKKTAFHRPKQITALYEWMEKEDISTNQLARLLRKSVEMVRYYRTGRAAPTLADAFLLERLSNGQVPVTDWLSIPHVSEHVDFVLASIETDSWALSKALGESDAVP